MQEQQDALLAWQRDAALRDAANAQAASQKAIDDAEAFRVGCAADRPMRDRARRDAEERRVKDEQKRVKSEERAAYLKKNCKRRDRAIVAPTNDICENDDGTLRRCEGIYGVEVVFECPASGPPGLRGTVVGGSVLSGQSPSRVARVPERARTPSRDELCAASDAAAATP